MYDLNEQTISDCLRVNAGLPPSERQDPVELAKRVAQAWIAAQGIFTEARNSTSVTPGATS